MDRAVMRRGLALALLVVAGCRGCGHAGGEAAAGASASAAASPPLAPAAVRARVAAIVAAEERGDSAAVSAGDLASHAVEVRRAAARALARVADERASKLLLASLADEDGAVIAWSAFGIGRTCKLQPAGVRALVARAATLADSEAGAPAPGQLDPVLAIADALARCGGSEAERTLAAWLAGPRPRADHAALALGIFASRAQHLEDSTAVALLDAASSADPLADALFAFSRLSRLSGPIATRLADVAGKAALTKGEAAAFAVRALGRAGADGDEELAASVAGKLGSVVVNERAAPALRASAARELPKLGAAGQSALATALGKLAPDKAQATADVLVTDAWGPLAATLEALHAPAPAARKTLGALAVLPLAEGATPALRRRVVTLRCSASALLAGTSTLDHALVACDPDKDGRIGALATLRVLDRGKIEGARHRRWLGLVASKDAVVREAAIQLMPAHPEIPKPADVIADALGADKPGVVATAAQVLAAYPSRGSDEPVAGHAEPAEKPEPGAALATEAIKPSPAVVKALTAAFAKERPPDAVEVRGALMDAAASLQILSFKPRILPYCSSPVDYLRARAEKALRLMGDKDRKCTPPAVKSGGASAVEPGVVEIVLETDTGRLVLSLDGRLAPMAVARLRDLAKAGFFDGNVVHRVVPGFVVQFGDPDADGYGGSGKAPLASETSPLAFSPLSVGMALAGAGTDTGSSQLFVTLGPYPHLDGDYPLIGHASGDWDKVAQGDVIAKASVR